MSTMAHRRPVHASDAELVSGIAEGDLGCLGVLFDRYETTVRRFAARLGAADADVDDIVQTVFVYAPRIARRYQEQASARAWLLGVTINVVRRHRRSLARIARRLTAWATEPRFAAPAGPDELMELHQLAALANRALAKLSAKKREVFVMVVLEGVPCDEVAVTLGVPVGTVWTRLHHAKHELRDVLSKESSS